MGLIYMRTSPSGGKYIGQTRVSEQERWRDHVSEANSPSNKNYNTLLNRAIRKYGEENFSLEILEDNIEDTNLDAREIYWIEKYQTYYKDNPNNYNMTRGGNTGYKYSDQFIKSLWDSGETIKDIKTKYNMNYNNLSSRIQALGVSKEEINKRAYSENHPRKKAVAQYTLSNEYIKTFDSISDAAREIKSNTTNISAVCNNKRHQCKGYIWKYVD